MTDIEIAWAAGLYEGEGSVYLNNKRDARPKVQARLGMKDEDVVLRFAAIIGMGTIGMEPGRLPRHSDMYRWRICGWRKVEALYELIGPYLGERRKRQFADVFALKPEDARAYRDRVECAEWNPTIASTA